MSDLETKLIEKEKQCALYEQALRQVRVDLETVSRETIKVIPALKVIEDVLKTSRELEDIIGLRLRPRE